MSHRDRPFVLKRGCARIYLALSAMAKGLSPGHVSSTRGEDLAVAREECLLRQHGEATVLGPESRSHAGTGIEVGNRVAVDEDAGLHIAASIHDPDVDAAA